MLTAPVNATILLVDDESDFVELVSYNITRHGHEVITASDGLEALSKARQLLPHLILLDLMLPALDGFTVCEMLRAHPSTGSIPIIMLTALPGEIARLNGFEAGADDYLQKSSTARGLIARVERILSLHPKRSRAAGDGRRGLKGT